MQRIDYDDVTARIRALSVGESDVIALMASIACELFHADDRFDWVGFYRNVGNETLKIGPYQGGHGCLTIPFSRGVCGAAARRLETQVVDDVTEFAGHIACADSTLSEIVVPVGTRNEHLLGVLDIDSNRAAAFERRDQVALEALVVDIFGAL